MVSKNLPFNKKLIDKLILKYPTPSHIYDEKGIRESAKELANLLNKNYDVPRGNKLKTLRIPKAILENEKLHIPYLRGLFDTDGSFYGRRNNEPVVCYTSLNYKYLKSVKKLLKIHGFNFCISGKDLYLYNKYEIDKFFEKVKPQNKKHILKHTIFKIKGKILKTDELIRYMKRE